MIKKYRNCTAIKLDMGLSCKCESLQEEVMDAKPKYVTFVPSVQKEENRTYAIGYQNVSNA